MKRLWAWVLAAVFHVRSLAPSTEMGSTCTYRERGGVRVKGLALDREEGTKAYLSPFDGLLSSALLLLAGYPVSRLLSEAALQLLVLGW